MELSIMLIIGWFVFVLALALMALGLGFAFAGWCCCYWDTTCKRRISQADPINDIAHHMRGCTCQACCEARAPAVQAEIDEIWAFRARHFGPEDATAAEAAENPVVTVINPPPPAYTVHDPALPTYAVTVAEPPPPAYAEVILK